MLCIGTCQVVVGFTKPVGGYESIQVPDRYTIVQYHDIFIFIYTHITCVLIKKCTFLSILTCLMSKGRMQ